MAETDFGALSDARKKLWATEITQAGRDQNFWMSNGFMGRNTADMTRPVQRITELTKTSRGDVAVMQLVQDLTDDGVAGDNTLEGSEESLVNDTQELTIDQLRHGVRSAGRMSEQRTVIRFRQQARDKLSFWLADKIDELMFLTAAGRAYTLTTAGATRGTSQLPQLAFASDVVAASSNRILYAGSATSEATLTASDTMTWDLILAAHTKAKRERMKPIRAGGRAYYVLIMSPEQLRDLKKTSDYKDIVSRGHTRGPSNPLFNNAVVTLDGIIIYDHQKLYNTLDAVSGSAKWGSGNTVDGAQALMLGSQALGCAMLGDAMYEESDNTDYKNRPGVAYGRILGMLKPQYKSIYNDNSREDFGVISLKTAAAPG